MQENNFTNSYVYITINFTSQNHTQLDNFSGWKGPLENIQSNPSAKAGSPVAGDTDVCLGGFRMSPERETPHPPGQLFQCPATLLMLRWNLVCFCLWPLLLGLLWAPLKSLAPSPLGTCLGDYLYVLMRFHSQPSLLQTKQVQFSFIRDAPDPSSSLWPLQDPL